MKPLIQRRKFLRAAAIAPFIIFPRRVEAFILARGGGSTFDPVSSLLSGMAVGQWKRLSGPVGNISNNVISFTRANFDGYGTGTFGTFSSGGSIGTKNAANISSFSKGGISVSNLKIVLAGGGHVAYEDGSFLLFDITAAANAVLASGHGNWSVAAQTGKLWPITDPKPANCQMTWGGTYNTASLTGSGGGNTATAASVTGSPAVGDYVSVTGSTPSAIPAGTVISNISGSTWTLSNNLQSSLAGTAVQTYPASDFWFGPSATGQQMMASCHTYNAINLPPGTTQALMGGTFGDFSNNARPGHGYVLDYSKSDGSNVSVDINAGGKGYWDSCPMDFCDLDSNPNLYQWSYFSETLFRYNAPYPTSGAPTTLATGLSAAIPTPNCEGVIMPDAVNGSTKRMFWTHINNQNTSGGFGVILNMFPVSGATYSNQAGTYTSTPTWTATAEALGFCYNPDLGAIIGFDPFAQDGKLWKVTINSSLDATTANLFASPTGDIPSTTNGYGRIAYDSARKCYYVCTTGDVYLVKAA